MRNEHKIKNLIKRLKGSYFTYMYIESNQTLEWREQAVNCLRKVGYISNSSINFQQ